MLCCVVQSGVAIRRVVVLVLSHPYKQIVYKAEKAVCFVLCRAVVRCDEAWCEMMFGWCFRTLINN